MSKRFTVGLDERSRKVVEKQIAEGRFKSSEEVVRAALKLLEVPNAGIKKEVARKRRQIARALVRRKTDL
jgi:putative addiction module CopG family antidote